MIRAMSSALSGLRNHQTMLDVVGNDIANVSTVGFKSSTTVFSDVLTQTLQGAAAPTATAGGTNPAQIGLGARLVGTVQSSAQGAIQRTGRSTDLADPGRRLLGRRGERRADLHPQRRVHADAGWQPRHRGRHDRAGLAGRQRRRHRHQRADRPACRSGSATCCSRARPRPSSPSSVATSRPMRRSAPFDDAHADRATTRRAPRCSINLTYTKTAATRRNRVDGHAAATVRQHRAGRHRQRADLQRCRRAHRARPTAT